MYMVVQGRLEHEALRREPLVQKKDPPLRLNDKVLLRSHPLGRNKIHDFWGQEVWEVMELPKVAGGPFKVRATNHTKADRWVNIAQLKKYVPSKEESSHTGEAKKIREPETYTEILIPIIEPCQHQEHVNDTLAEDKHNNEDPDPPKITERVENQTIGPRRSLRKRQNTKFFVNSRYCFWQ